MECVLIVLVAIYSVHDTLTNLGDVILSPQKFSKTKPRLENTRIGKSGGDGPKLSRFRSSKEISIILQKKKIEIWKNWNFLKNSNPKSIFFFDFFFSNFGI